MTDRTGITDWESYYRKEDNENMPWYLPILDHDFEKALAKQDIKNGRVLDIGSGPGTQALAMVQKGFDVTATDISFSAIKKARDLAQSQGLKINFYEDDIVNSRIKEKFNLILDRGVFHIIEKKHRKRYANKVYNLLEKGGFLFLKCFSIREPGNDGPYRISPDELKNYFQENFFLKAIIDTKFKGNRKPNPKGLFGIFRRK